MNYITLIVLLSLATLISCETEADEFDDGVTVEDENVNKSVHHIRDNDNL